jgi:hypothetical protein
MYNNLHIGEKEEETMLDGGGKVMIVHEGGTKVHHIEVMMDTGDTWGLMGTELEMMACSQILKDQSQLSFHHPQIRRLLLQPSHLLELRQTVMEMPDEGEEHPELANETYQLQILKHYQQNHQRDP